MGTAESKTSQRSSTFSASCRLWTYYSARARLQHHSVLLSFPKGTAASPTGLRVQHLIDVDKIPLPTPICSLLPQVVNILVAGKAPASVSRFIAGARLIALNKVKEGCPPDIRPIAVGELYIAKERQKHCKLIPIIMVLLNVASASATRSIVLKPPDNCTVFQNDTPANFSCNGNGFGTGAVVSWTLNGTGYNIEHAQMGITYVIDPPTGDTVSSHLIIPSNSTINNNTQVVCRAADVTFSNVLTSQPSNLTIQGLLQAPSNVSVKISNTSNLLFLLSWGAPFSLDVTDSPDIFYYTLCTNITIYGCRTIPSDPDCTYPKTCTSSFDFTDDSQNCTNGEQNNTIMDCDSIHFTFFAVNGAGNGTKANFTYLFKQESALRVNRRSIRTVNAVDFLLSPHDAPPSLYG
ncbi:hypothetical protein EMCRGX_G003214 [Ephydatia muelleri]